MLKHTILGYFTMRIIKIQAIIDVNLIGNFELFFLFWADQKIPQIQHEICKLRKYKNTVDEKK